MRQVISLCAAPFLLEHPDVGKMFPADAIARAKTMLGYVGSIGAYSDSRGAPGIRQEVSNYIQKRDGYELTVHAMRTFPHCILTRLLLVARGVVGIVTCPSWPAAAHANLYSWHAMFPHGLTLD